jgi:sulfur-carrier protein
MTIRVMFFGVLSEVAGIDIKHYNVRSISDLKHRLEDEFPEIRHYNFRISLNNEIINSDKTLNDNDEVALLPPFAGG